jgi:glycosyltransferase involved in cell wall biosynthesis
MIYFDVTKSSLSTHASGLNRVSQRLQDTLSDSVTPIVWDSWNKEVKPGDWFITADLFSEDERPGIAAFLKSKTCKTAAIFHDLIPLRFPHITWPNSVGRHPKYLQLLRDFTHLFSVSDFSKQDLLAFWKWQGIKEVPPIDVISLGADFTKTERIIQREVPKPFSLLSVGIIEPRKNQTFILDVCKKLWDEGLVFEMHFVGRKNPHFGAPILEKINHLEKHYQGLYYHAQLPDDKLLELYHKVSASIFATKAEGCGLPLLESLWMGVPCFCSDLPVLKENANQGGCIQLVLDDLTQWSDTLRDYIQNPLNLIPLCNEATRRELPLWNKTASMLLSKLNTL